MRYSLLNRFRGALLGSFIGEALGSRSNNDQFLAQSTWMAQSRDTQSSQTLSIWNQIALRGTESLVRCGKLDVEDWIRHSEGTQPSFSLAKATASSSEVAVAALPVALFFHEDDVKLRQQLLQVAAVWLHESQVPEELMVVAYAIACALTEKLEPSTLIPQILDYLNRFPTPLVQQLEQVQALLEKGAGLATTHTQLRRHVPQKSLGGRKHSDLSIALAFYCFLSTPEDFRLCVTRALQTSEQPQLTATLTGTLAGVYNSIIGIPVGWRLTSQRSATGVQWMQSAQQLFAVWSGVYDVSVAEQFPAVAVAAPRVIQPR